MEDAYFRGAKGDDGESGSTASPDHPMMRPSSQSAKPGDPVVSDPAPAPGFANELVACLPVRGPYDRASPPDREDRSWDDAQACGLRYGKPCAEG
jgi:hypothetical protein